MSIFSIGARTETQPVALRRTPTGSHRSPKTGAILEAQRVFMEALPSSVAPRWSRHSPRPATWMHRAFHIFIMAFPISRTNSSRTSETAKHSGRWSVSPPTTAGASTARRRRSRRGDGRLLIQQQLAASVLHETIKTPSSERHRRGRSIGHLPRHSGGRAHERHRRCRGYALRGVGFRRVSRRTTRS